MEYRLSNEQERVRLVSQISTIDLSKPLSVTISEVDRSIEQNKKLHGCLADISRQVEHAGMKWDVTVWKRLCTAAWLRETGETIQMIPAIDGKGIDILYERTSKLSIKKCADLISWVEAFGAEHGVRWSQADYWGGRY